MSEKYYIPCPVNEEGFCSRHKTKHFGRLLELSQMRNELGEKYRLLWDGYNEKQIKVFVQGIREKIKRETPEPVPTVVATTPPSLQRHVPSDLKKEVCHIWTSKPGELQKHAFDKRYAMALKLMTDAFVRDITNYPEDRYSGRGIVITAGGKYFPSAYVTIRIIRYLECNLPISLFYFGRVNEIDDKMRLSLQNYAVEFVDLDELRKTYPFRILNGFECKLYAVQHSNYEEVLFLDADSYPKYDPQQYFENPDYLETGSVWFPDLASTRDWTKFDMFGVEKTSVDKNTDFETGQFLINKRKCWKMINLANFWNEYSDLTYKWGYGDKGPPRAAFSYFNQPFTMFQNVPGWLNHSYLQYGPNNETWFIHRCRDKFRFEGENKYHTPQTYKQPTFEKQLPHEEFAFQVYKELNDFYFSKADQELPSLGTQLKNFATSLVKYIASGAKNVTDEQYDKRIKTCLICPNRTQDWRCKLCGCFLSKKALWASEKCPDNRWDDLTPKPEAKKCGCGK